MNIPEHGGQLPHIAAHFNIPVNNLIDFSANINPEGPPTSVIEALRKALEDQVTLTTYPDLASRDLCEAIAAYACTPMQSVAVANGFVPLLEATLRALNIKRCLLPVPAFNEYRRTLERNHVHIEPYRLEPEDQFAYDPAKLIARATAAHLDTILLANPQNPTGILTPLGGMTDLLKRARANNLRLLVDEAFMDYTPHASLIPQVSAYPNLIVFRSVTKFHGIPGMRAAYLVSHPDTCVPIKSAIPPWPITRLAEAGVIAALSDRTYAKATIALNETRRFKLASALKRLGIATIPGAANYLMMALPTRQPEELWEHMIQKHNVVLRLCTNFESLPPNYVRIAVRNEEDNARLIAALAASL